MSEQRGDDVLDALIILSEGGAIPPEREARLIGAAPSFARRNEIAYVVVDRAGAPEALRSFAVRAFGLQHVETDGSFELYRPR